MKKFLQTIWQTRAFRLWLMFVFCALLYRTIILPIVGITQPIDLVMVPYLVIIPLLFLTLFDDIRWKHALVYSVPLLILVYVSYAYPQVYILLLLVLLVALGILWWIAREISATPWKRFGIVVANIVCVLLVYAFQLGYNPIAFAIKGYSVIPEERFTSPWECSIVKKNDKYGLADPLFGKEIVPICFDTIYRDYTIKRRIVDDTIKVDAIKGQLMLMAHIAKDRIAPYVKEESIESIGSGGLMSIKDTTLYLFPNPLLERLYRRDVWKPNSIRNTTATECDDLMDAEFTRIIYSYRNTLFSDVFDLQKDTSEYDKQYILDLAAHRLQQSLEDIEAIAADTISLGITSQDINDLRRTLARCIMVSGVVKARKEHYIYAQSMWMQFVNAQLPDGYTFTINHKIAVNMDQNGDSTNKETLRRTISSKQLAEGDYRAWRDAFLISCQSDFLFYKDQLTQVYSFGQKEKSSKALEDVQDLADYTEKFRMRVDSIQKSSEALLRNIDLTDTVKRVENLRKALRQLNEIIDVKNNAAEEIYTNLADKLAAIDFPDYVDINSLGQYAIPQNELDSLLFIETPQRLIQILNTNQYVELAAAVEEIVSEVLVAAFMRGYNVQELMQQQLSVLDRKHRLHNYLAKYKELIDEHNRQVAEMERMRNETLKNYQRLNRY